MLIFLFKKMKALICNRPINNTSTPPAVRPERVADFSLLPHSSGSCPLCIGLFFGSAHHVTEEREQEKKMKAEDLSEEISAHQALFSSVTCWSCLQRLARVPVRILLSCTWW